MLLVVNPVDWEINKSAIVFWSSIDRNQISLLEFFVLSVFEVIVVVAVMLYQLTKLAHCQEIWASVVLKLAPTNLNEEVDVSWIFRLIEIEFELWASMVVDMSFSDENLFQFPEPIDDELKTQITPLVRSLPITTK